MIFDIPDSVSARHVEESHETGVDPAEADWAWYQHHCPEVVEDLWQTDEEACARLAEIWFGGESK